MDRFSKADNDQECFDLIHKIKEQAYADGVN